MIDLTKPIELMDGTPVINPQDVIYTDINGQIGGVQVIRNCPEPKKVAIEYWLNVYSNGVVASHDTKEHADEYAVADRIACVHRHTIVEVGFGL